MVMVVPKRHANTPRPRFRTLPWHDTHPNKLDLEQRLAPDHLARTIDQAIDRLDLTALRASYHGTGSAAQPPAPLPRRLLDAHPPRDPSPRARPCRAPQR